MKAIILAGGKGTRLKPITCELPKPMVPVVNIPLMEHILLLLKKHGIQDIGVTLMYLPQKIKSYFGDGTKWGVHLTYFMDETPSGTAGSVLNAASFLDDTFLVISGDCITDINLTEAIEMHRTKKNLATIVLTRTSNPLSYGIVVTDDSGNITSFLEKPTRGEVFSDTVNTGIYVLEPGILKYIESGHPFDFSRELFPKLLDSGLQLSGYTTDQYWSDVGSLESYLDTHKDIMENKTGLHIADTYCSDKILIGPSTIIEPTALINGPCMIGNNCYIGHNTVIDSYTVIGNNCIIEDRAFLKRSILHNNITVGSGSEIRGSILGSRVRLMKYVSSYDNVVIGEQSIIQERSIIRPNIRIWPGKTVEPFSVVDRSIVHSIRYTQSLFQNGLISGTINVDITPEFASRLGSAFGSILGRGNSVVVSSDISGSYHLFEYALISGLISTGVQVYTLRKVPAPVARLAIRKMHMSGGVHIGMVPKCPERLVVDFFDETGANLDHRMEKNVELVFHKEDFSRCRAASILDIIEIDDFVQYYARYLKESINTSCIQNNPPTLFVMSDSESMLLFLRNIFRHLHIPIAGEMLVDILEPDRLKNVEHFLQADITAFIDCRGERLVLMDSQGRVPDDNKAFLIHAYMLFHSLPGANVVAPLNMTSFLERMALKYGGSVTWTKVSRPEIIRELLKKDSSADALNQYFLCYDAVASLAKTIQFLCMNHVSLDSLMASIPACNIRHTSFLCPFESIGRIMRIFMRDNGYNKPFSGGIKIKMNHSWVLIHPDPQKPFIHLYVEGHSMSEAVRLLQEYSNRISGLLAGS